MGISKRSWLTEPMRQRKRTRYASLFSSLTLLFLILATGCTPVRPVVKIGLIAPFEGLYRDSGYGALAAMRQKKTQKKTHKKIKKKMREKEKTAILYLLHLYGLTHS